MKATPSSVYYKDRINSIGQRLANSDGCFALIWTCDMDNDKETEFLFMVNQSKSVESAWFSRKNPYVLQARFDPSVTSAPTILAEIQQTQARARIVG